MAMTQCDQLEHDLNSGKTIVFGLFNLRRPIILKNGCSGHIYNCTFFRDNEDCMIKVEPRWDGTIYGCKFEMGRAR